MIKELKCVKDNCILFHEDKKFNCLLQGAENIENCRFYTNREAESALAWLKRQAEEIAGPGGDYSLSQCTRIIANALKLKSEYDWENVIIDCEVILGLKGHATSPLNSNLPNVVRDLKNDKPLGKIKILYNCGQCSHKKMCPIKIHADKKEIQVSIEKCELFSLERSDD